MSPPGDLDPTGELRGATAPWPTSQRQHLCHAEPRSRCPKPLHRAPAPPAPDNF